MKIVFLSNFFNHHQWPLSDALDRITGGNFCFIETEPIPNDRRRLGYGWANVPEYVVTAYKSEAARQHAQDLVIEADVVIAGSTPDEYLWERIKVGKLIFRYSERPLKQGLEPLKYFVRLARWHWRNPARKPIYLLSASAYAAADYAKFGLFRSKAYQWGYFPEALRYERLPQKEENSILWVGRFLDWKHPDDALRAVAGLRDEGRDVHLRFIGMGPMEQQLRDMVSELRLEERVSILGSMRPEQVRAHMERASIFLFTSDRQEGWGAVVNEAMNSGCAVVASHAAGCVPYLVKDGVNGLVYRSEDVRMLTEKVRFLLDHPQKRAQMGAVAYETIIQEWNSETAARRLVALAQGLCSGEAPCNESGPCSPAQIIKDQWIGVKEQNA